MTTKHLVLFLSLFYFGCTQQNNSPCLLHAIYDSGSSGCSFYFRKDGTFEWANGGGLGGGTTEGKYTINGDIITLNKIGFDRVIKSERLLITSTHPNSLSSGTFLIQVDKENKLIDSMFIFTVNIDKRDGE